MFSFLAVVYLAFEVITNRSWGRKMLFYFLHVTSQFCLHAQSLASCTRVEICYGFLCLCFMFISGFALWPQVQRILGFILNKCLQFALISVT